MRRRALIIYSDNSDHGKLPGAQADSETWKRFLTSPIGGEWYESEIAVLSSPSRALVDSELSLMSICDIGFVAFSGHGYHKSSCGIDETFVCLNNHEDMKVADFNCGADRLIVIADSCRGLLIEASAALTINKSFSKTASLQLQSRKLYEKYFEGAERGAVFMYACSTEEAANESDDGGYFSGALVENAVAWSDKAVETSVWRTNLAFEAAVRSVKKNSPQQNPQYVAGRRLQHFPFALGQARSTFKY